MYFDLQPKTEKKDLFGVDYAFKSLLDALSDDSTRFVIIKGLRRVGKTSLMNSALNECPSYSQIIDVRESPYQDQQKFFSFLVEKINQKIGESLFHQILRKISGIGVSYKDFSAQAFFSKPEKFQSFFESLNKQLSKKNKKLVLAFDEAQLLKEIRFDYFLASTFDNYRQIKVILTGSEVGLLNRFIGKTDYDAPLYGRACFEIGLKKMKEEETAKFLEVGFAQINRKISFVETREVIENLDGIIGWITHYGWLRRKGFSHESSIQRVKEEGKELVKRELKQFLEHRKAKAKYSQLLDIIARGGDSWSIMKLHFNKRGIKLTDHQLNTYLKELLDYGFIEKGGEKYNLSDPLMLVVVKN